MTPARVIRVSPQGVLVETLDRNRSRHTVVNSLNQRPPIGSVVIITRTSGTRSSGQGYIVGRPR